MPGQEPFDVDVPVDALAPDAESAFDVSELELVEPEPFEPEPVLPEPVLPEPVRQRVIQLAAAAMSGLPVDELPSALRRVAKFAPNRRARLGGAVIATQITGDPLLRQRLATRV